MKLGETKCKADNDCLVNEAACRNDVCQCSQGDDYVSEDKTMCRRKDKITNMINIVCTHIHINTNARTHAISVSREYNDELSLGKRGMMIRRKFTTESEKHASWKC